MALDSKIVFKDLEKLNLQELKEYEKELNRVVSEEKKAIEKDLEAADQILASVGKEGKTIDLEKGKKTIPLTEAEKDWIEQVKPEVKKSNDDRLESLGSLHKQQLEKIGNARVKISTAPIKKTAEGISKGLKQFDAQVFNKKLDKLNITQLEKYERGLKAAFEAKKTETQTFINANTPQEKANSKLTEEMTPNAIQVQSFIVAQAKANFDKTKDIYENKIAAIQTAKVGLNTKAEATKQAPKTSLFKAQAWFSRIINKQNPVKALVSKAEKNQDPDSSSSRSSLSH